MAEQAAGSFKDKNWQSNEQGAGSYKNDGRQSRLHVRQGQLQWASYDGLHWASHNGHGQLRWARAGPFLCSYGVA